MKRRHRLPPGLHGVLRVEPRASRLVSRLQPGDIAVLDEVDLDGATAAALVSRGVVAVVNAAPSSSGRYPNLGPAVLVEAGVALIDGAGGELLTAAHDGEPARLDGATLFMGEQAIASGVRHDQESVIQIAAQGRAGASAQLADFTVNATAFGVNERGLLDTGEGLPEVTTPMADRHVLVVGPGRRVAQELHGLRRFRRRYRPILIGVEGGAEALRAVGWPPDLLVGEPSFISDSTLRGAGQVCLPALSESQDRLHQLAVPAVTYQSRAAAEDVAVLLAHHAGARSITLAGMPRDAVELLDRGREAAASGPFTRIATAMTTVSAQTAARLTPRKSWAPNALIILLVAALATVVGVEHEDLAQQWRDLGR